MGLWANAVMSYPSKKYLCPFTNQYKTIDNVQLCLYSIFAGENGERALNLLSDEYFLSSSTDETSLKMAEGVRRFIQMIKDTKKIIRNCKLEELGDNIDDNC